MYGKIQYTNKKQRFIMRLPSNDTLYTILIFLLTLMVVLGILFDTDYN